MHLEKIQAWLKLEETDQEELVSALLGLTGTESRAYFLLLKKSLSVQELCNKMRNDRTTAQRVLQTLVNKDLAHRVVEKKAGGGINYIYKPIPLSSLKDRMDGIVDSWGSLIKQRIKDI